MVTQENLGKYYKLQNDKYRMLTRQFEHDLPSFISHDEARDFFKRLFGEDFVLMNTEDVDDEKMYFYTIVHDRPSWERFMKELKEKGYAAGMDYIMASQDVQITESGHVHIVF